MDSITKVRFVGDATQINSAIAGIQSKIQGLGSLTGLKTLFNVAAIGAAVYGMIRFGQSVDDLNDSLSVGQDIAKRFGGNINDMARQLIKATDGDISFRESVQLTAKTIQALGLLGVDNLSQIGLAATKIAPLLRTDVSGAIDTIVTSIAKLNFRTLKAVIPTLKEIKTTGDPVVDMLAAMNTILVATADIAAPGGDPFTRLKNSLLDFADALGQAIFSSEGEFATGIDAIATKLQNLASWVEDNQTKISNLGDLLIWFAGAAVLGNAVIWIGNVITAIRALGITVTTTTAAITATNIATGLLSTTVMPSYLRGAVAMQAETAGISEALGKAGIYATNLKVTAASLVPVFDNVGISAYTVSGALRAIGTGAQFALGWLIKLGPQLLIVAAAWVIYNQRQRYAQYETDKANHYFFQPGTALGGVYGRWGSRAELGSASGGIDVFSTNIGTPHLPNIPVPTILGGGGGGGGRTSPIAQINERQKQWDDAVREYMQALIANTLSLSQGLITREEGDIAERDARKTWIDTMVQLYSEGGLSAEHFKTMSGQIDLFNAALDALAVAVQDAVSRTESINTLTGEAFPRVSGLTGQTNAGAGVSTATSRDAVMGVMTEMNQSFVFGEETEKVFDKWLVDLAEVLGNFLDDWGWNGGSLDWNDKGKGLAKSITGVGAEAWGGNLASFLGLGASFAGPMAGLISGGIGLILNKVLGHEEAIKLEQPVDVRIESINPQLRDFFNFRGINVYNGRYRGVIESGLW